MLDVVVLAVAKVIVAVLVGAITCASIPNVSSTLRDFSFLISNVLLPCLTIANTTKSVDVEVLMQCSILVIFALLLIAIGLGSGLILPALIFRVPSRAYGVPDELAKDVRLLLRHDPASPSPSPPPPPPTTADATPTKAEVHRTRHQGSPYVLVVLSERLRGLGVTGRDVVPLLEAPSRVVEEYPGYFWGTVVACSIQNTVTLPLSLLQNLSLSLDWIDFSRGSAYIFVFSVVCTLYLWAFGPNMVERAQSDSIKRRRIREIMERHRTHLLRSDAATQTAVLGTCSPLMTIAQLEAFPSSSHSSTMTPHHIKASSASSSTSALVIVVDREEAGAQTDAPLSSTYRGVGTAVEASVERVDYDWSASRSIRVVYERDLKTHGGPSRLAKIMRSSRRMGWRLLTNVPFMSIVISVIIGIIPPLRGLFFGGPLEMIMDAITLISQGTIPSALLLLGANLVGSTKATAAAGTIVVQTRECPQNTHFPLSAEDLELLGEDGSYADWYNEVHEALDDVDLHQTTCLQEIIQEGPAGSLVSASAGSEAEKTTKSMAARVTQALSLAGVNKRFVWTALASRLLIIPLCSFVILVTIRRVMPFFFLGEESENRTLLLVLFMELGAPSAINSTLLFTARDFMTYPWAKMLFFQYICCILTVVLWTSLGLLALG